MSAGPDDERRRGGAPASSRATTPLLTLLTTDALDQDYEVAARRRAASGAERPRGGRAVAAVTVGVFGLLAAVGAVQTSRDADVVDASRATLAARVEDQRAAVLEAQQRVATLRAEDAELDGQLADLADESQIAEERSLRLQTRTGLVAVRGPGVEITLEDAPDAEPAEVLRDSDLTLLVNGLWTAGAEAIAVDGQRLSGQTAIRNSGPAIEVNSVGIAPPYTVTAIGDPLTLQAGLLESPSGQLFASLGLQLGFTSDMQNVDDIAMPAAPRRYLDLSSARPLDEEPAPQLEGDPT